MNINIGRLALLAPVIAVVAWIGAFTASVYVGGQASQFDPDDWMTISVEIEDATFGDDHAMRVERIIHRPFSASWTVEIETAQRSHMCAARYYSNYELDDTIPERVDLFRWWMLDRGKPETLCVEWPLPVGCYYASTRWLIVDEAGKPRTIPNTSNRFCVIEK